MLSISVMVMMELLLFILFVKLVHDEPDAKRLIYIPKGGGHLPHGVSH